MSYRNDDYGTADKKPFSLLLKVGAGVLAFIVAKALVSSGLTYMNRQNMQPLDVERRIESDPSLTAMYAPLKQHFPQEYEKLITRVAELSRGGASEAEIHSYVFGASRTFVQSKLGQVASASSETLAQLADAQSDLTTSLANENVRACAEFGMTGVQKSTSGSLTSSSKLLSILSQTTAVIYRAAHEGTTQPVKRPPDLSEQDAKALISAVRAQGLPDRQTEVMFSDGAARAGVEDQCKMTVALYGAVASLPTEQSARLTAYLLRASRAS